MGRIVKFCTAYCVTVTFYRLILIILQIALINKVTGTFLCKKMRRLLYFSCLLHTIQIHSANLEPPHPTEIIEKRQGAERWCEFAGNRQPLSMNHEDQPKKRRQKRDPQCIVRVTLTPRSLSVER